MKKRIAALCAALSLALALVGCGSKTEKKVLNVYNWGEYISDGSEDSLDTIRAFEDWYKEEYGEEITVNYNIYASPNSLVYNNQGYIDDMGEEAMAILYPELGDFSALYNEFAYRSMDTEMPDYLNTLWENVKIN